jgi:CspA family cold shock protein
LQGLKLSYARLNAADEAGVPLNIPSNCRTARIGANHAMILPHDANPRPDGIFGKDNGSRNAASLRQAVPRPCAWRRQNARWCRRSDGWRGHAERERRGRGKDVFVHISAVERAGLSSLNEGQTLEYEIVSNRGKESADNLKVR